MTNEKDGTASGDSSLEASLQRLADELEVAFYEAESLEQSKAIYRFREDVVFLLTRHRVSRMEGNEGELKASLEVIRKSTDRIKKAKKELEGLISSIKTATRVANSIDDLLSIIAAVT